MKAVCLVAHPDDCIIFAYAFINHFKNYNWHIVYLTHEEYSPRGQEIRNFWNKRKIKTSFLGFNDNPEDTPKNQITFDKNLACDTMRQLVKDYDIILTHGMAGEYGHIHHKFIWQCLRNFPNLITFAYNRKILSLAYTLPESTYDLAEVPLHADIIKLFHVQNTERGFKCYYKVSKLRFLWKFIADRFK
jgi:hypothetical protein